MWDGSNLHRRAVAEVGSRLQTSRAVRRHSLPCPWSLHCTTTGERQNQPRFAHVMFSMGSFHARIADAFLDPSLLAIQNAEHGCWERGMLNVFVYVSPVTGRHLCTSWMRSTLPWISAMCPSLPTTSRPAGHATRFLACSHANPHTWQGITWYG